MLMCIAHVFYNEEDLFGKPSTGGVRVGDTIEQGRTSFGLMRLRSLGRLRGLMRLRDLI